MGDVDAFLARLDAAPRAAFAQIVTLAMAEVPDAEQGMSYGMPALKYRGRPLVGFAEAKEHLSLFPFSPDVVDAVRDRLEGYSLSKGTVRFSPDHLLPDDVVSEIIRLRMEQIDQK